MCAICNSSNFSVCAEDNRKIEQRLGYGNLVIRCDLEGKNFRLAVNGEPKSEFIIYHCPTCGKELY